MSFKDAVQTVLTTKFATFSGRARRSEYWWFALFSFPIGIVANGFDVALDNRLVSTVVTPASVDRHATSESPLLPRASATPE